MIVTTQKELDNALAAGALEIIIDSPEAMTLVVQGSSKVQVRGSSNIEVRDSVSVEAWGSATVVARDFAKVEASDFTSIESWDSTCVVARGFARVGARGSSTVMAHNRTQIEAYGYSSVMAYNHTSITARDFASVVARDTTHVDAWDSTTIEASGYVAVHVHSSQVSFMGGVVIDLTTLDLTDLADWTAYHGVEIMGNGAIVYKAVDADLRSERGFAYPIGETVTCPDWDSEPVCGGGLHFSPSPTQAHSYYEEASRFLRCVVPLYDITVINGTATHLTPKLKARTARVLCEVDVYGQEINK